MGGWVGGWVGGVVTVQPPPCEATDTCEAVGDAVEAAALPMQHLILFALHL